MIMEAWMLGARIRNESCGGLGRLATQVGMDHVHCITWTKSNNGEEGRK